MPPIQITLEEPTKHLKLTDRRGDFGHELYHLTESAFNRSDFARSTVKGRFSLYSIVFDCIRVKFQTQTMFVRIGGPNAV